MQLIIKHNFSTRGKRGAMGRMRPEADVDRVQAHLLRAAALLQGNRARLAAPPPPPRSGATPSRGVPNTGHSVEVLEEQNRLHSKLLGFFDVEQGEAMVVDIKLALARLRPGFDVISDTSKLGTVTPASLPALRRVATALVEAGMRQLVRVVGAAPGAAHAVARAVEGLYAGRVVASFDEATRLLDDALNKTRTATPPSRPAPRTERRRGAKRRESAAAPAAKGRR